MNDDKIRAAAQTSRRHAARTNCL